jgi:hypothetical protein
MMRMGRSPMRIGFTRQLGVIDIPRDEYKAQLARALEANVTFS